MCAGCVVRAGVWTRMHSVDSVGVQIAPSRVTGLMMALSGTRRHRRALFNLRVRARACVAHLYMAFWTICLARAAAGFVRKFVFDMDND